MGSCYRIIKTIFHERNTEHYLTSIIAWMILKAATLKHYFKRFLNGRSRADKNHCGQKSIMFQDKIITEPKFYEPHFLAVKISESCILCILSIQFFCGVKVLCHQHYSFPVNVLSIVINQFY